MIKKSPIIRAVGFLRRNPKLSPEEFKDYWLNVHAPMVKGKVPGLIYYTGKFALPGKPTPETPVAPYDGIVELGFDSVESLQKALNGPSFNANDRQTSSTTLIDLANTEALIMEEYFVEI
jgi:uncharacterized protein (TIGR02118 family)